MKTPHGIQITAVDVDDRSEAELTEAARFQQALSKERVPEDPPTPIEAITQRLRAKTEGQWRAIFAARDESGKLVGTGFVGWNKNEPENAHARWTEVNVLPGFRRRGIGRALMRSLVAACLDQRDDLVFFGQTSDRVPAGDRFAEAVAATAGLPMKQNQLDLAAVDRAKVAEWSRLDPRGYRLERADDVVPDRLVQAYLDAANSINDMPKGDLRFAATRFTEAQLRDRESWLKPAGMRGWAVGAGEGQARAGGGLT